jgi:hypothetical protein
MKKRFGLTLVAVLLGIFLSSTVWAAGSSATISSKKLGYGDKVAITVTWVSDDATGAVSTSIPLVTAAYDVVGFFLYAVETYPGAGAVAPTADYDIAITNAGGLDVCAANTLNRHTSSPQCVFCSTATQPYQAVQGTLTFAVTAAGNSKEGSTVLIFTRN